MITQDFYRNKAMKKETIELKVMTSFPLHGVKSGKTVSVEVDKDGMPFDRNWRKRLIDSKIDGCVEIVKPKKTTKKDND